MMAKIVKGSGAKGIVDYILDKKKQATLIDCQGVLFNDNGTITKSFIAQSRLNLRVNKFIGHISLSFSKQDLPRLTDELMIQISREYMEKMGIRAVIIEQYTLTIYKRGLLLLVEDIICNSFGSRAFYNLRHHRLIWSIMFSNESSRCWHCP